MSVMRQEEGSSYHPVLIPTHVKAITEIASRSLDLDQVLWSSVCPNICVQIACADEVCSEDAVVILVYKVGCLMPPRPWAHKSILRMNEDFPAYRTRPVVPIKGGQPEIFETFVYL